MKTLLQRLLKAAAYTAAGIVILLAVAVGLFRLFLPRLPEYQDEIKRWASTAIGMQVEFSGMDARWGLRGPELKFYGAELIQPATETRVVAAREVGVGVSLARLLLDRTLVVDTLTVSDTSVELRRLEEGSWLVQGNALDSLLAIRAKGASPLGSITVIGENIELQLIQPGDERPEFFRVPRLTLRRDNFRIALDATIRPPETFGRQIVVSATHITGEVTTVAPWNVSVEADDFHLPALGRLLHAGSSSFDSGSGDFELSLAVENGHVRSAVADVDFQDVEIGGGRSFDLQAHVVSSNDREGWLIEANDVAMRTADDEWTADTLRFEASVDSRRNIVMFQAGADYVDLGDLGVFAPLFGPEQRALFERWQPDGALRDLDVTAAGLDQAKPVYTVKARLDGFGFAAGERLPGVRGFTGSIDANHDGGQLQINSTGLSIGIPSWLPAPLPVDTADGTVIWRRGDTKTTILSDNVALANAFMDSQSNVEIVLEGDESPFVDLASSWRITDMAEAKRFIPEPVMHPRLFLWFQDALVAGRIPRGSTRLTGPLDAFPFDNGEGRLLVEANVRDLTFRYLRQFPPNQVSDMDVVLENMRLYTERNRTTTLGNTTVDARVEIEDLRDPVLTIDAFSTGTLATIRDFAAASPISRIFGGQLDRISVAGEASLKLDLTVPLRDARSFSVKARVQTNSGSLAVDGLKPEITDLSGAVTIERELVTSESLGGRFLGEPVAIELRNATPEMDEYRVIAAVTGAATGSAIADAFEVPVANHLAGRMEYRAEILFPRAGSTTPKPFSVRVESDLAGLAVDLPPPFDKSADSARTTTAEIAFLPGGEQIETSGRSGDAFAWTASFAKLDDGWDFDRGTLLFGSGELPQPDVRGLHVRGRTPLVRFEDWLGLSRGESAEFNAAERVRSIDLEIGDLYILGQHLENHQVRVDRSARDWLVQFEGSDVSGSIFVPYDFSSDRALVLDMARLVLPGDESRVDDGATRPSPDPQTLPPISLKAGEFALGERYFGEVSAEFMRAPGGLASDDIIAKDESFEIVANGRWVSAADDPLGSRSFLTATLTSRDVAATMQRLNYQPGIVSDDMAVLVDVNWSGGPRMDFLQTLDGEVRFRFGTGQLDEVDPGAGRVFGLMSIVALPRRLSLDFRDVFQKGLGFDKLAGSFVIDDGVAYTCDLSLEGPAADIGVIGRIDLVDRNYQQTAVVSANFGNTLPVVGALAAGPQVAAAMFLFSQIFKEPLKDIGQVYYAVSGPWDEPLLESADANAFAASGELAGCLEDSE